MQTRRSFLSRLGAIVAVVALAPQIAFSRTLDIQSPPPLNLQELIDNVYAIARTRLHQPRIDIYTDKAGLDALYAITGESAFQSPLVEPVDIKACGHAIGIYEQLRTAS